MPLKLKIFPDRRLLDFNDKYRFLSNINKSQHPTNCHIWVGHYKNIGNNNYSYGLFTYKRFEWIASRFMWWVKFNQDPKELYVCHTCNNKKCVNPDHLYLATCQQNLQDAHRDGLYPNRQGENGSTTKLTNEQVTEIRDLYYLGETTRRLAKKYNVSQANVSDIITYKIWTHI